MVVAMSAKGLSQADRVGPTRCCHALSLTWRADGHRDRLSQCARRSSTSGHCERLGGLLLGWVQASSWSVCFFMLRIELTADEAVDSGVGALGRDGNDSRAAAARV